MINRLYGSVLGAALVVLSTAAAYAGEEGDILDDLGEDLLEILGALI